MTSDTSVTEWIEQVKQGIEGEPQEQLVARFLHRLSALARKRLRTIRSFEDEDDVALSAMKSFFLRAPHDEFSQLTDRNALWSLLAAITLRKTASLQRRQMAGKRDVRRERSLEEIIQHAPSDAFLDSVIEEGNLLLEALRDPVLQQIATMRLQGYGNQEIADHLNRSVKTVERKLNLIRKRLKAELEGDDE
jgi:DNA-directed RNA polymerase specialized sigma24 family protein